MEKKLPKFLEDFYILKGGYDDLIKRYRVFRDQFNELNDDKYPRFKEKIYADHLELKYKVNSYPEFKEDITKSLLRVGYDTETLKENLIKNSERMNETRNILFSMEKKLDNIGKVNTKPIFDEIIKKGVFILLAFILGGLIIKTPFFTKNNVNKYYNTEK